MNGSKPHSPAGIGLAPRRGQSRRTLRWFLSLSPLPWGEGEPIFPRRTIQTRWLPTGRCALFSLPEGEYLFSALAAPVAQTCSLPYRWFLTCQPSPARNVPPITNRRYGRLRIRATLNTYEGEGQGEEKRPELPSRASGHSRNSRTGRVLRRSRRLRKMTVNHGLGRDGG